MFSLYGFFLDKGTRVCIDKRCFSALLKLKNKWDVKIEHLVWPFFLSQGVSSWGAHDEKISKIG